MTKPPLESPDGVLQPYNPNPNPNNGCNRSQPVFIGFSIFSRKEATCNPTFFNLRQLQLQSGPKRSLVRSGSRSFGGPATGLRITTHGGILAMERKPKFGISQIRPRYTHSRHLRTKYFVKSMQARSWDLLSKIWHWRAKLYYGGDIAQVKAHVEDLLLQCTRTRPEDLFTRRDALQTLAEVAFYESRLSEAMGLLQDIMEIFEGRDAGSVLWYNVWKGVIASRQGGL
ncbi:hypothetical protein DFH29DRAFT_999216 [Suillus ampliporus]|nr:hypothetical protein DFH29DRAFT_999216 [Suillus ampliporus]